MRGNEIKINGITTGDYADNTISINTSHKTFKSVSIKNTDGANGLKFVLTAYFDKNEDTYDVLKGEASWAAGELYNYVFNFDQYDHIKVTLKDDVANTPATYLIVFNVK